MFEGMLATQGVSPEESEPYRNALDSDEALRAVYNHYRAISLWIRKPPSTEFERFPYCSRFLRPEMHHDGESTHHRIQSVGSGPRYPIDTPGGSRFRAFLL
jgi:hypothetical protein